jgi:hypothetical protein
MPMTDREPTDVADPLPPSPAPAASIGKSIVHSFKQSLERMRSSDTQVPAPPTDTAGHTLEDTAFMPAPSTSHLGSGLQVSVPLTGPLEVKPTSSRPTVPPQPVPPAKPAPQPKARQSRQARRARLRISRIDPWSVMKTFLLFGVAGWIIVIVATWVTFTVLDGTGVYDVINNTVATIFASPEAVDQFNVRDYVNTTRATAVAALVGAVDVIIMTALATIFAFLYNLSAVVMGGIEVTMAED